VSEYLVDALAFGPHPDDVELFCGGTMLKLAGLGHTTAVVDLTRGELGSHGSAGERAREAEAASAVLGLLFRENLELPDGFIDPGAAEQLGRVVEVLRRRRPEIVLCPWRQERHPDHIAASGLVTRAVFFAGLAKFETTPASERFVPRQLLYYAMRHRMPASFVVDTSAVFARKLQAVTCYASQVTRRPGEAATLISSPLALEAIEARDRYHGSLIGTSHGEPLHSQSTLAIGDPLAHFRENSCSQAQAFEAGW
jgi:N-acetylglucosamine malate deacetylase 1